jgi:hypothetical protein
MFDSWLHIPQVNGRRTEVSRASNRGNAGIVNWKVNKSTK